MQLTTQILVFLSLGLVAYAYLGYPLVIFLCSRLLGRKTTPPEMAGEQPFVSVLVSALNEETVIGERVQNALEQVYPADRHEIVIASDGSTDRTAEIVRGYAERFPGRVRLLDFPERRGKANVLNCSLPEVRGEIVVLSDANTFFDSAAIGKLARWFQDPQVGSVCGKLLLVDPHTGNNVDGVYWHYETFLKICESRLGALLGSNGAIYAIRRQEYEPIPGDTIIDDFVIPLQIKLRTGKHIVYDAEAIAREETPANVGAEFRRRTRIGAGGFQSLFRLWPLLLPTAGWTSFAFWSHKVLRWLCPAFLLVALVANAALVRSPQFQVLLLAQVVFYAVSFLGAYVRGSGKIVRLMRVPTMFTSMNLALLAGFWRWIAGRQRGTWQRTAR